MTHIRTRIHNPAVLALRDFDRFLNEALGATRPANCESGNCDTARATKPRSTSRSAENGFELEVELPGIAQGELALEAHDGILTLETRRAEGSEVDPARRYADRWQIPNEVDAEAIAADLKNGLLRVQLPLAERARKRSIEIGE